ncbi:response regulator [Vibrio sp. SS-MA-C1-2]|uniref:response regulator n=1 Tax=Vibrio sp. SS-MA-C1-2 TaxID=2908646 RepID=UPI001F3A8F58|nr:response regulator [Vibrio sp. SS-MA-C1-2]UJF18673.1 response regulator [Vibrio sp. SS-MA-C1-2]
MVSELQPAKEILLVEDDAVFSHIITQFLVQQGYEVRHAEDGIKALQELKIKLPDIMLCDLQIPYVTGMEVVEEVSRKAPALPIIVISGTGDMNDVAKALRLGVKDFLVKPIRDLLKLQSTIEAALRSAYQHLTSDEESEEIKVLEHELHGQIEELNDHPEAARQLLTGLLPNPISYNQGWELKYFNLQSTERLPVIIDYIWLIDGRLMFYILDPNSAEENSTATSLLVRTFFNDYLRTRDTEEVELKHVVRVVEKGILQSGYARSMNGIFGLFEPDTRCLHIDSIGLGAKVSSENNTQEIIQTKIKLGDGAQQNNEQMVTLPISGGRLQLNGIMNGSFTLTLHPIKA